MVLTLLNIACQANTITPNSTSNHQSRSKAQQQTSKIRTNRPSQVTKLSLISQMPNKYCKTWKRKVSTLVAIWCLRNHQTMNSKRPCSSSLATSYTRHLRTRIRSRMYRLSSQITTQPRTMQMGSMPNSIPKTLAASMSSIRFIRIRSARNILIENDLIIRATVILLIKLRLLGRKAMFNIIRDTSIQVIVSWEIITEIIPRKFIWMSLIINMLMGILLSRQCQSICLTRKTRVIYITHCASQTLW